MKEPWQLELEREIELLNRDLPPELKNVMGAGPEWTQSRIFTDYQYTKGTSGNPRADPVVLVRRKTWMSNVRTSLTR